MENAYGIGVKNRYELFYDEDVDPLEIIRQQEEEKERRKTDKSKDKTKTTKAVKQATTSVPKKAKENAPTVVSKPTEVIEPPAKPRNRTFGEKNKNISFDDTKDNEERKNFRNRDDQYFNPDSSGTFNVRNSSYKRGNQERDSRPEGEFRRGRGGFRGRGGGRGGGGGGGGGRGRGGGFSNFESRPRREFDRHSGSDRTGVRSTDKREGGGANNWGDIKDDIKQGIYQSDRFRYPEKEAPISWDEPRDDFEQTAEKKDTVGNDDAWGEINEDFGTSTNAQTEAGEKTEEPASENTESKENEPATDAEAAEEAVKEMTLDEWKREQESKRSVPKYNLRKPGEGEDNSQWKKLYVLKKKIKEDDDDEEEEEEEDDEEYGRRGRHRQVVDIPINFTDSRRGGRGRGGRGRGTGPRGGGGSNTGGSERGGVGAERESGFPRGGPGNRDRGVSRGAPKMKPTQQSAPKVDDFNDFPSLVTA